MRQRHKAETRVKETKGRDRAVSHIPTLNWTTPAKSMCQRMPPYGIVSQIAAHCLADPPRPRSGPGSTGPARTPRGAARSMSSSPQAAGTLLSPHEAGASRAPPCTALPRSQGGKEEQMRRTNQKGSGARPAGAAPQRTARRWPTARATALKRSIASTPHAPTRRGAPRAPWARRAFAKKAKTLVPRKKKGYAACLRPLRRLRRGGSPSRRRWKKLAGPRGRTAPARGFLAAGAPCFQPPRCIGGVLPQEPLQAPPRAIARSWGG